jgi:hypothetical protein
MVVRSICREQLLYPTWTECDDDDDTCETTRPPDEDLIRALRAVRLEKVRGSCAWPVDASSCGRCFRTRDILGVQRRPQSGPSR